MDYLTYQKHALSIEGRFESIDCNQTAFLMSMDAAVHTGDLIDQLKKVMAYGRAPNLGALLTAARKLQETTNFLVLDLEQSVAQGDGHFCDEWHHRRNLNKVSMRLMHHAFGRFGEASELMNALLKVADGEPLDVINYVEEMGDGGWYDPLAYDTLGINEECVRVANLAKLLVVRYNKGFSGEAATHRKLASEREVIEWVISVYRDNGMPTGIGDSVLANCRALFCAEVSA